MKSEWKEYQISELCDLIVDCVNKTAPVVEYETPYKMIRTPNIRNGVVDTSTCRFVEKEVFEKWTRRATVNIGDVLLTREAPMGEIGMVKTNENLFLGQRVMQYRANPKVIDSTFLLYSFLSPFMQSQIFSHEGSGSVVSHIRVPDCSKFRIKIPSLSIQKQIAKILGDLDDKIALNTQINQTLVVMAQALFKSWFVDFHPVNAKMEARTQGGDDVTVRQAAMSVISGKTGEKLATMEENDPEAYRSLAETADLFPERLVESELGLIPVGWEVKTVGEISKFQTGRVCVESLNLHNYITTDNMLQNKGGVTIASSLPTVTIVPSFEKGQVLVSNIRPYFKKIWFASFNGGHSNDVLAFEVKEKGTEEFLYNLLYQDKFFDFMMASSKGSKMPRGDKDAIMKYKITYPVIKLLKLYSQSCKPMLQIINANSKQCEVLATVRDALLPKLLSGEIDFN